MSLLVAVAGLTNTGVHPKLGNRLAEIRELTFTQVGLATKAGVSHSIVQKLEAGHPVSRKIFNKIAKALDIEGREEFAPLIKPRKQRPQQFASAEAFLSQHGLEPQNIQAAPTIIPSIPEWTAEIACGHWIDCAVIQLDMSNGHQADTARRGMFIVRCMGDSMRPTYQPGARVLFRCIRLDDEPLRIGADYYWQNSDGQCTLKRLKAIDEEGYTLSPLNKKYKPLRLARQMLAKVAIVESIIKAPWE